jgi:TonB family protein
MPPRILVAFTDARRRLLPLIVQQRYNEGKSAFERQEYAAAAGVFKQVLDQLSDADLSAAANQPPLADLRTLALGFFTLSEKATPPPAPPPPPVVAPPPPRRPSIYTGDEPDVVPPVVVRQQIPNFIGKVTTSRAGVVEIIINENGTVDAARIQTSLDPSYDERVISAAKHWAYKPATVDGMPVKFLRRVRVVLNKTP